MYEKDKKFKDLEKSFDFSDLINMIKKKLPRRPEALNMVYLDFDKNTARIFYKDYAEIDCIFDIKLDCFNKKD